MAINPYQSVLPGTEGNVYAPPKINPYQNVIPGTTGNVLTVPPPTTTTLQAANIGATPIQLPKTPTPIVPTMPAPLAPTEGGVQLAQNADGTVSRAATQPTTGTPTTPPSIDQQATTFAQAQAPMETPAEAQQTKLQSRFTQLYEKLFGKPQARQEAETAQGIPQKSQAVADIQAQINQLQNDASVAMIKAQTAGETSSFGNAQIAQIERDRTVKALQLNSFLFAAQGNLLVAQDMADKAVKAQFEPAELEIEYLREFLAMNEKSLSREDKKRADALKIQLDERTRLLEEQKATRSEISGLAIEAAKAGADAVTLQRIGSANTIDEAIQIAAENPALLSWAKTMQEEKFAEEKRQFGMTYALAQQKARATTPITQDVVVNELGQTLEYGTPEYVVERLKQTSGSTTKPVASEREQLGKFANVVALTDNLMNSLSKTTNDPIIGYLRSLNPYDFDARAVNAQVTALVPSVARALYGEVGVLTDTDIERYLKTLPNIKSTTDQNKFIAAMTLSNARRAYEQTLLNLANSKVNVAGFSDSYKNLTERLNKLEGDISVDEVDLESVGVTKDDQTLFDDVVSKPTGYWSNIWNAITGK